ncbi:rho guanine nucleotide exchange factor 26 isoform X4 [Myotis myotis]|uniref:rho guanine nucleotide exchange factor 26 isoform X4 n=1 Tax=Myotis myotis TaxID=51298 RepID=UPI00174B5A5A|nr:rho guanine nucleotide exchange factor 26 isoform X4 [Myotis myotis]
MDGESEVNFSSNSLTPSWRRRSTPQPQMLGRSKPRPQSYQSPSGLLITDFPVEDRGPLPVAQTPSQVPTASDGRTVQRSPLLLCTHRRPVTNGRTVSPEYRSVSPRLRRLKSPQTPKGALGGSPKSPENGTVIPPAPQRLRPPPSPNASAPCSPEGARVGPTASPLPAPAANGLTCHVDSPGCRLQSGQTAKDPERGPSPQNRSLEQKLPLQRLPSQENELPETPSVVLSTNSPAALKVGKQQIIPKSLASEIKISKSSSQNVEPHKRLLKVRSMVEGLGASLGPSEDEGEVENDLDSPGSLRRGLRSTSYRRAVVSGVDFDSPTTSKKKNRMSQPILKVVMEDKEKFSSLGRIKKKVLKGQGPFDGEENAVLYQNYKEKALDIDSDEESEPREQKSEEKIVIQHKPLRSTWSQLSAVKRNGLSQTVSQEERKRQEAIFEVISSEHSYLLSLEILIRMFKNSKELSDTMTKTESHHLFSNITDVCEASKKATNPSFKEVLSRIESHEDCRNLPMISFLILPMQRVTRLPLLMDTICQKTPKDSPKYEVCKRALKEVSKLVRLCNEGARKMERTEMMYTINSQLEFKIKPFPLVSSSRWLVKRGELTAYVEDTVLFSKRTSKQQVYFFLFNDVLIITKKKSEESYNVNDYSLRDQLLVESCDNEELTSSPGKNSSTMLYSRQNSASHLFTLTVLSNHANEKVEMLLGAETQNATCLKPGITPAHRLLSYSVWRLGVTSDAPSLRRSITGQPFLSERARWITALGHSSGKQPPDRTSLTQVEIIRSFTAKQPDELSLQVADVVLIYQRVSDGWYEGERLRDGERGWFPMECAKEITCQATIDKNVERMGRLLGLETNV